MELVNTGIGPKRAAVSTALAQLPSVYASTRVRRRLEESDDVFGESVVEAVQRAVAALGDTRHGAIMKCLLFGAASGLTERRECAADQIDRDVKTVIRETVPATWALMCRLIDYEFAFISRVGETKALLQADPVLRALWAADGSDPIILANGEIAAPTPQSRGAYHVQAGDLHAMIEAYAALSTFRNADDIAVLPASRVKGAELARNIVSIGGPRWNVVTRELLDALRPPYRFGSADEFGKQKSALIGPSRPQGSGFVEERRLTVKAGPDAEVTETWGFALAAPNPRNDGTRVLVLAGLSTLGVLGATRGMNPSRLSANEDLLVDLQRNYSLRRDVVQVVVPVGVIEGEVIPITLKRNSIYTRKLPRAV